MKKSQEERILLFESQLRKHSFGHSLFNFMLVIAHDVIDL